MTPPILFAHGWGYDRTVWHRVAALLPDRRLLAIESGYLGEAPSWPEVPDGVVLVGHSAGVLSLLRHGIPASCAGLVSINGFTRFVSADGFPGVAGRMLTRMEQELAIAPGRVLRAFRARCGDAVAPAEPADPAPLAAGLAMLRRQDARAALDAFPGPVLALAAEDDPIVSPAHTLACFGKHRLRWSPAGGHLLPLTQPDRCAALINEIAC